MGDFADVVRRHMDEHGMSIRATARAAGYKDHTFLSKALNGHKPVTPSMADRLDNALGAGGAIKAAASREVPAASHGPLARGHSTSEALDVMTWITGTNASDDALEELARASGYLAEAHAWMPAAKILTEVLGLHRAAHGLLCGGRQRLSQTRELLRIDSVLLAHACLLLGDLGQYEAARAYGSAALLCAQECEANEGLAWTALADRKVGAAPGQVPRPAGLAGLPRDTRAGRHRSADHGLTARRSFEAPYCCDSSLRRGGRRLPGD
jgi:hypothetical protein